MRRNCQGRKCTPTINVHVVIIIKKKIIIKTLFQAHMHVTTKAQRTHSIALYNLAIIL